MTQAKPSARPVAFDYDPPGRDTVSIQHSLANHLLYTVGKDPIAAKPGDWENALAHTVRDRLVERWMNTTRLQYQHDVKRVYYLSAEFLIGRALSNGLMAVGLYDQCRDSLQQMGLDLEELKAEEPDAALGNGGLGRLAACFLDSMATVGLPGFGYGIRYDYGMFAQKIQDGRQVETPDHWLAAGNPWEFPRPEVQYKVQYGGRVEHDAQGRASWVGAKTLQAMAYDTIIPGHETDSVITLRLWSARAADEIDLKLFSRGEYLAATEDKNRAENVSRVLYPDDSTQQGRELRLLQQYFFCSASLQDIVRRHLQSHADMDHTGAEASRVSLDGLADKVAVHLNDTHPAIAVPELMRILVDIYGVEWNRAWALCSRIFSYTNHTLMPEALETWPVEMMGALLPRHLEIIYCINHEFLQDVRRRFGDDNDLLRRVSLIDEEHGKRVRMGYLSIVASHKVNGVSKLHSDLMVETIFADFARIFPGRFTNMTNGVTPRRWLAQCNPGLSALIDAKIGRGWRTDLDQLAKLKPLADEAAFAEQFRAIKLANKQKLAKLIADTTGVAVNPASLFDVQVKRIHEYKRQLLNVLHVITRYNRILANPDADWVPRTVIFAGKAASAYFQAKLIIKLIHDVANKVNNDPRIGGKLKVVFVPNYSVSVAETLMPAADLSEQISTAGTEASGTGNMKLALNGALTIGTLDGANIEIGAHAGWDNIFIFGKTTPQVQELERNGYQPRAFYDENAELRQVLTQIGSGFFSPEEPNRFHPIVYSLLDQGDRYFLLADYADYVACQDKVDTQYRDQAEWTRKAILNVASMGFFSSDRTIREYARDIWQVQPLREVLAND
ncbi:glycogen/starch/alpha-glucan phosphorylase [Parachitinimonas caeni]|uniref:Alpha-1,4 glucan phosphorylase n=1 Tax=Parachitinimonas caeni TaxID=3031301 RepID=A0ABT7DXX4_9NEIS|nr:glycogen/starch/alpha-glucan phosphorylase [Parachitinimonas caeni]MDK2123938.1 glycogen/starch/alpha-glucan phosphorylase [Parachitinimonas caeni]